MEFREKLIMFGLLLNKAANNRRTKVGSSYVASLLVGGSDFVMASDIVMPPQTTTMSPNQFQ
jgi:hypothetical protein